MNKEKRKQVSFRRLGLAVLILLTVLFTACSSGPGTAQPDLINITGPAGRALR